MCYCQLRHHAGAEPRDDSCVKVCFAAICASLHMLQLEAAQSDISYLAVFKEWDSTVTVLVLHQ